MKPLLSLALVCALYSPSYSSPEKPHMPKAGSSERKAILNSLRVPVERDAKQKIVFYQVTIRVKKNWAYVVTMARDSKGKKLKQWDEHVDPTTFGLLREQNKKWKVLYWGAGTGMDAVSEARIKYPKAPRSLFPSMPDDFPGDGPMTDNVFNNRD